MTRDEILNMEAGREMDALIAEKVMGWVWYHAKDAYPNAPFLLYKKDAPAPSIWEEIDFRGPIDHLSTEYVKHYSTDIAAAWEVVEKVHTMFMPHRAMNIYCSLNPDGTPYRWTASFGIRHEYGEGDTAPLAICRAALLAVIDKERER